MTVRWTIKVLLDLADISDFWDRMKLPVNTILAKITLQPDQITP